MKAKYLVDAIMEDLGVEAFFGVPDSLLRAFCDELAERGGEISHVVAADEGGACGLAAGHFLATGRPACVYMQNSGIGNAVNPICSLLDERVYAIPALFVVGWRGEPGVHDEPQHVFQGMCSRDLLECVGVHVEIIGVETGERELREVLARAKARMDGGRSTALLVRKGAVVRDAKHAYEQGVGITRESAVEAITEALPHGAAVVSTTGKLSRELFEIRERRGEGHDADFLTVGSMGHSSMIGLGVALAQPSRAVVVLDGDGAALMHSGAMAIAAANAPANYIHVLVNNRAHESVGGMPTASPAMDWCAAALAFGYASARSASTAEEVVAAVGAALGDAAMRPAFVEVQTNAVSRPDLGRPTTAAYDNGRAFQGYLCSDSNRN